MRLAERFMRLFSPAPIPAPTPQPKAEDDTAEGRALICRIAHEWEGTPYHPHACVKGRGGGCDCLTLITCVYQEAGMLMHVKIPHYSPTFFLHRSEETYLEGVLKYSHEVQTPEPGDIVLFKMGRAFGHGGIVIKWPTIIHAICDRPVTLADAERDGGLRGREKKFFSIW